MLPTSLTIEKTYAGVSRYSSNRMVLSLDGMRELRSRISFTQLRFHCHKQQHGRTFETTQSLQVDAQYGGGKDVLL